MTFRAIDEKYETQTSFEVDASFESRYFSPLPGSAKQEIEINGPWFSGLPPCQTISSSPITVIQASPNVKKRTREEEEEKNVEKQDSDKRIRYNMQSPDEIPPLEKPNTCYTESAFAWSSSPSLSPLPKMSSSPFGTSSQDCTPTPSLIDSSFMKKSSFAKRVYNPLARKDKCIKIEGLPPIPPKPHHVRKHPTRQLDTLGLTLARQYVAKKRTVDDGHKDRMQINKRMIGLEKGEYVMTCDEELYLLQLALGQPSETPRVKRKFVPPLKEVQKDWGWNEEKQCFQ